MKKILIICLFIIGSYVFGQSADKEIYGCYWHVDYDVFSVINKRKIIKIEFCNLCDNLIYIDTASYSFINDTLVFNYGLFDNSNDNYDIKWTYVDSVRFYGDGVDYLKINIGVLNEKLEVFGLQLLEIDKQ